MDETPANTIVINWFERTISYRLRDHRRVVVRFPPPKPGATDLFRYCCSIAIAQDIHTSTENPTDWPGADQDYLHRVVERFGWKLTTPGTRDQYWKWLERGAPGNREWVTVEVTDLSGERMPGMATELFRETSGYVLGVPHAVGDKRHELASIKFHVGTDERPAYKEFRAVVTDILRERADCARPPWRRIARRPLAEVRFDELLARHEHIIGRDHVVELVTEFIESHDRGLLVLQAEPGKGKTAIMAHMAGIVFAGLNPQPVHFFYLRRSGIVDPNVCVRSLYASLLRVHSLEDEDAWECRHEPDILFVRLEQLLREQIAPTLADGSSQLIFIDGLDEATSRKVAFQRLPDNLPKGVYVIATTRQIEECAIFAGRPDHILHNLDSGAFNDADRQDSEDYVFPRLDESGLPRTTMDEIVRLGAGNFLVLELLCRHITPDIAPAEVSAFLRRLATHTGPDRLGFCYKEFWKRLEDSRTRADMNVICDVVGLFVVARGPLNAHVIAGTLGMAASDVRFALSHLSEYVNDLHWSGRHRSETAHQLFHESYSDFLAKEVVLDPNSLRGKLADFCRQWKSLPEGYTREYALRYGTSHLCDVQRHELLHELLFDFEWMQAKLDVTDISALVSDYDLLKGEHEAELLQAALRLSTHVLQRDPTQLAGQLLGRLGDKPTPAVRKLLEEASRFRGAVWLRPLGTPLVGPGSPLLRTLAEHGDQVEVVRLTPDGERAVSASRDGTIIIWDWRKGLSLAQAKVSGVWSCIFAITNDGRHAVAGKPSGRLLLLNLETGNVVRTFGEHTTRPEWPPEIRDNADLPSELTWDISAIAAVPGKPWVVSAAGEGIAAMLKVWGLETGEELLAVHGLRVRVESLAVTPNGRYAVAGMTDHTLTVVDLESGRIMPPMEGHQNWVAAVAVTPDGRHVVSGSWDKSLKVWELSSGVCVRTLLGHEGYVRDVAIAPDGRTIVSASHDETLRIWSIYGERPLRALMGHDGYVTSVAITPDGRRAISSSTDRTLAIWDLETVPVAPSEEEVRAARVRQVAIMPGGRQAALVTSGNELRIWDVESGRACDPPPPVSDVRNVVSITPDGRHVISRPTDDLLEVRDLEDGKIVGTVRGEFSELTAVSLTPDRRVVVAAFGKGQLVVWDLRTGDILKTCVGQEASISALVLTPDARRAVTTLYAYKDLPRVLVWDLQTGIQTWSLEESRANRDFWDLALMPDGRHVVTACSEGALGIWDIETGEEKGMLPGHRDWVMGVAVDGNGRRIVSASYDRTVRVWDLESRQQVAQFTFDTRLRKCDVSPDGETFVVTDNSGGVHVLRLQACGESRNRE